MLDINQSWGSDIAAAPNGDLQVADSTATGQQRVLRRLLTNPGEYLWHLDYGAGLRKMIGLAMDVGTVRGIIRSQILLEAAVAQSPAPTIDVQAIVGGISVFLQYTDAPTRLPVVLSFDVTQ